MNGGHILISSDNKTLKFYSNGVFLSFVPVNGGRPPATNKAPLTIGMTEGRNWYSGFMDDIRFYNRVLSEKEVESLYKYESKPPANPIKAQP